MNSNSGLNTSIHIVIHFLGLSKKKIFSKVTIPNPIPNPNPANPENPDSDDFPSSKS